MSVYIDILNQIKEKYTYDWLMPSQSIIYDAIEDFIGPPHKIINIYGKEGSGKTFLGWVLNKRGIGKYFSSLEALADNVEIAIIDNTLYDRDYVRGLRNTLWSKHVRQAIILTRYRAEDSIPTFLLELNEDDIQFFKGNLFRFLNLRSPEETIFNLWKYIHLIAGA